MRKLYYYNLTLSRLQNIIRINVGRNVWCCLMFSSGRRSGKIKTNIPIPIQNSTRPSRWNAEVIDLQPNWILSLQITFQFWYLKECSKICYLQQTGTTLNTERFRLDHYVASAAVFCFTVWILARFYSYRYSFPSQSS